MTESRTRRELVVDRFLHDTDDSDGWYGHGRPAQSTDVQEVGEPDRVDSQDAWLDDPDTDRWHVPWDVVSAPRDGDGKPAIGEWTFTVSTAKPWYRSKHAKRGVIAAAALAIAVPVTLLVVRSSAVGTEESSTVPSQAPTSSQPAPTSPVPALSPARPSPAPSPPPASPPAPPPPPADASQEPIITRQYPQQRQSPTRQTNKPEIGVTRTPVIRKPISATPPAPPPPQRNSSTPGDSPGGGSGWPW